MELGLNSALAVECCELHLSEVERQSFGLSFTLNHRAPAPFLALAHFLIKPQNKV